MKLQQKVAIFFTGGTIGMRKQVDGSVKPALHLADLLQELPLDMLSQLYTASRLASGEVKDALEPSAISAQYLAEYLLPVEWADLPSPHMTPALMFALAKDVDAMLQQENIAGVVVAHGTDVMEETAFMLDLVVNSPKPVVVTGAMRSFGEAGYDGLRNLGAAIATCFAPLPKHLGTVVLMTDKLFAAREVTKVHSMGVDAFDAPASGPIGTSVAGGIQLYRTPMPHSGFFPSVIEPAVDLITLAPGMDGRFLACSRAHGAKGIVVEGFGAGNVPPSVIDEIELTVQANIPVVLTSRCIEGGVWPVYGYSGGANQLQDMGVILGGNLRGQKARILLMVALGLAEEAEVNSAAERLAIIRSVFAQFPH